MKVLAGALPGLPGERRTYDRWDALVEENVEARVLAGVHFRVGMTHLSG